MRLVTKSGDVVFAYLVDMENTIHGRQIAAESIVKHLKSAVLPQLNELCKHPQMYLNFRFLALPAGVAQS